MFNNDIMFYDKLLKLYRKKHCSNSKSFLIKYDCQNGKCSTNINSCLLVHIFCVFKNVLPGRRTRTSDKIEFVCINCKSFHKKY